MPAPAVAAPTVCIEPPLGNNRRGVSAPLSSSALPGAALAPSPLWTRVLHRPTILTAGATVAAVAILSRHPDAQLAARCRADVLDVDRIRRERHDARAAGQSPSPFLVEGARTVIFGERPETRLVDIRFA